MYQRLVKHPFLTFFTKFLISIFLIYWMIADRKYSLSTIQLGLLNIKLGILFLGLTFLQLALSAVRTRILINVCNTCEHSTKKLISMSWAASFIASVAPSSLFGDLFRIKNLTEFAPNLSLDDRVYISVYPKLLSFISLVMVSATSGFMIFNQYHNLRVLLVILYILISGVLLLFIFRLHAIKLINVESKVTPVAFLKNRIFIFKKFLHHYLSNKKLLYQSFAVSLLIQFLNTLSFLLIIITVIPNSETNLFYLGCLIPIGILFMTLPISISGLGVGHIAFSKILLLANIPNGADIFSIFFAFSFIFNFIGLIPFLFYRKTN